MMLSQPNMGYFEQIPSGGNSSRPTGFFRYRHWWKYHTVVYDVLTQKLVNDVLALET